MTSVTVAGGSFDAPRRVRRMKAPALSPRHQTWLRYGVGVSIACLLSANGFALVSMLGDAARELTGSGEHAGATVPSSSATQVADGAGFAAFEVPADLDAHYRSTAGVTGAAGSSVPAATGVAPAGLSPIPATEPDVSPWPSTVRTPANPPLLGGNGPSSGNGNDLPSETAPSIVDQVVATIATVPEVGSAVAPVVETVASEVETSVVDPSAEAVADPAPAPVDGAVTSTVGAVL